MKAIIKNFMGCESAEIEANKIALILGLNGQGKTSSLLPIAAALRGGVPLGLTKTKAGMLIKTGAAAASVTLENDTSKVSVSYPKCERLAMGSAAPKASEIAAGIAKFPLMSNSAKIELLRSLTKCEPDKNDLYRALSAGGISDKVQEIIYNSVETHGFDASLDRAKEKGRSLKEQWRIITGEPYGEKKGATYFPAGFENDLEGLTEDTLETELTLAKAELDDKIAKEAVSQDELLRLRTKAEEVAALTAAYDNALELLEIKSEAARKANKNRKSLPELPHYELVCPHCQKAVVYEQGKLTAIKQSLSSEERSALEQKILDADNALSLAIKELNEAAEAKVLAQEALSIARKSAEIYEQKKNLTTSAEDVNMARENVKKAEARLIAFNKYHEALRVHNNIIDNQKIINVLDPAGIRLEALEKGLNNFNAELSALCRIASFEEVSVDSDMTVNYASRPLTICSESEKFRATVILQILIASLDNSDAVVIDAADILDSKSRGVLFKLLARQDFVSFVGMTVSSPDKVPDLKKLGIGKKYWIENGILEEVYNG